MNYRHAFHAGNFADCMKHALLVWLLRAFARKQSPFFVLDTHAGAGAYALEEGPAKLTGEWRRGIGLLLANPPPALADYLGLVQRLGLYPGSPLLIRACLREGDRLACCELHPEDVALLRARFVRDRQVGVHARDGYEALRALLPPREGRGLVLIDPPFEDPEEYDHLLKALRGTFKRFRHGVYAVWYPIKHRAPVRAFHTMLAESGIRDILAAELVLREPTDPTRLNGSGLVVINPPFRFEEEVRAILSALLERLGTGQAGAGVRLVRLADE
ncbi:MAG: 23S rRNA (adenine(2030)-N(6))-methyltransferase RlmJ [Acidobacteriia bacterium]|nr:23S rRNA (adenine(2030)-N(6))-methyltransferase RlmJ [Methyloceanibacter sp.]MCL6490523.1 23S rRNA (adenine(2030)-N(6))-methyltransferase RlmJ [Terriglobia bacterium]